MRARIIALGVLPSMTAATACTFLDVTIAGTGGGGTSGSGTGGGDASSSTSSSAASSSGDSGCCDCDSDGYDAITCGGDDCDDGDKRVFPGQTEYFDTEANGGGFDFDCDKSVDKDPSIIEAYPCTICLSNEKRYLDATSPACGEEKPWGTCKLSLMLCVNDVIEYKKMRCR